MLSELFTRLPFLRRSLVMRRMSPALLASMSSLIVGRGIFLRCKSGGGGVSRMSFGLAVLAPHLLKIAVLVVHRGGTRRID